MWEDLVEEGTGATSARHKPRPLPPWLPRNVWNKGRDVSEVEHFLNAFLVP